eukprot:GILJ01002697.1.p1 GENE.GILJ01002697.1~~GILJ01002697.1.p1  ORF type:complete len:721 (+),score=120.97 GILJ01002697.1:116-2278(+)
MTSPHSQSQKQKFLGVVSREALEPRDGDVADDDFGLISIQLRGKTEEAPYDFRDVISDQRLKKGDNVQFELVDTEHDFYALAVESAPIVAPESSPTNRQSEEDSEIPETGVVCSTKDYFGFLKCADRDAEVFFHFSELRDRQPVVVGDEFEFVVGTNPRTNKTSARKLRRLPRGTVSFEVMSDEVQTGIVQYIWIHGESFSGNISSTIDGQNEVFSFHSRDVESEEKVLSVGDQVEFRVLLDRPKKKLSARHVKLIKRANADKTTRTALTGDENDTPSNIPFSDEPTHRETGIIGTVKESFGFIECCDRPLRVFYHRSESDLPAKSGDEVEFAIVKNPKTGKPNAIQIKVLPPGTVSSTVVLEGRYSGTVIAEPKGRMGNWRSSGESAKGKVKFVLSEEQKTASFTWADLEDPLGQLGVDDEVEFSLQMDKRTKQYTALKVTLIKKAEKEIDEQQDNEKQTTEREKKGKRRKDDKFTDLAGEVPTGDKNVGMVMLVKDTFGFLWSDVAPKLFYHQSEVEGGEELKPGDEIEFYIVKNARTGNSNAIQIKKLPSGTLLERLPRESGVVESIRGNFGFIECKVPHAVVDLRGEGKDTPKESAATEKETKQTKDEAVKNMFFHTSEVEDALTLNVGDEVEFTVIHNLRTKELMARKVKRVKEVVKGPARPFVRSEAAQAQKIAKGPDGTKGFHGGRGKALSDDELPESASSSAGAQAEAAVEA